jgi:hypothetical protein
VNNITDEANEELDVIMCNIDERMHGPPRKMKIRLKTRKLAFTSNGVGLVCTILFIK